MSRTHRPQPRRRRLAAVVALLVLAGCSSDEAGHDAGDAPPSSAVTTSAPPVERTDPDAATVPASIEHFDAVCAGRVSIADAGTLASVEIAEASGLAASRLRPGTWWIHNDSGDTARVFLIDDAGTLLARVTLDGAEARDWEDVAVGPPFEGDAATVYVGDTGDNAVMRDASAGRGTMRVYRFTEPATGQGAVPDDLRVEVDTLHLELPDEAHDVEALLVDPVDGDLLVVTKDWARRGAAAVYRAPAGLADGSTTTLDAVGSVPLEPGTLVTAADVTADGAVVALRSYGAVHLYRRAEGEPLWSAFDTAPCEGPVPTELQGESLGFAVDATSYLTVSEGEHATLHRTG